MQTEFHNGRTFIQGTIQNPRSAERRAAAREIARQEAVAARFQDPEQVEAIRARHAHMAIQQRRNELALKIENIDRKLASATSDLAKAERAKAAAEERLRSLREAERELAEMRAADAAVDAAEAAEDAEIDATPSRRGPGRPRKAVA